MRFPRLSLSLSLSLSIAFRSHSPPCSFTLARFTPSAQTCGLGRRRAGFAPVLWRQAAASFDDREYRHALPLWQELAAASSSAFEGYHGTRDAEGLRVQITAAFNLALTYEQLGA